MEQLEAAMPQAVTVTPEEREAIERVCSYDLYICTFTRCSGSSKYMACIEI